MKEPIVVGSEDDIEESLQRVRWIATLLDSAVQIPGTSFRIGLDPIIGLVPGVGDILTFATGVYPVYVAARCGATLRQLLRMVGNLVLDSLVGAIPILGDIFDFAFKSHKRNLKILEEVVASRDRRSRDDHQVAGLVATAVLAVITLMVALLVGLVVAITGVLFPFLAAE